MEREQGNRKQEALGEAKSEGRLLLTIPEVAERLGMGRTFVYQLVLRGEIPSIKLGRSRRVPVVALEEFVASRLKDSDSE